MALALIVSPIRSWPLDQGNRARVLAIGEMLKERGFTVHFLLSELEGRPNAEEMRVMRTQWDRVDTVPYRHDRRQRYAEAWGGDDWYDPALDAAAEALTRIWNYDLCLVNYAWYSRVLDIMPPDVFRIIDTHDAFGDRHKRLFAAGTTPVWYFTRPGDEGECLDRADLVFAIQEEEQRWFESLTDRPVRTIGHVTPSTFLPPRDRTGTRLRGGYLASGNPSNQLSINTLIRHWAADPFLAETVELHVAGPICRELTDTPPFVVRHGFVDSVQGFYANTDFSVNPNIGGSGLKIKSIEALSYGRALFATEQGMLGICPATPPYVAADVAAMTAGMSRCLAADPELGEATRWARTLALSYRRRHIDAFDAVVDQVKAHRRAGTARRLQGGRA